MRSLRRTTVPSDRRAARLVGLTVPAPAPLPIADATGVDPVEALGRLITLYGAERLTGRGERRECDDALREVARRLATQARAQDAARAECLLIDLKPAWARLPALRDLPTFGLRQELWDRVVRLLCEEFYAPAGANRATAA